MDNPDSGRPGDVVHESGRSYGAGGRDASVFMARRTGQFVHWWLHSIQNTVRAGLRIRVGGVLLVCVNSKNSWRRG